MLGRGRSLHDELMRKPHDTIPRSPEPASPPSIKIRTLLVIGAIDHNDELDGKGRKVDDVFADDDLAAKRNSEPTAFEINTRLDRAEQWRSKSCV